MTASTMLNNLITQIELNGFTERQLKLMLIASISKLDMVQTDEILQEIDMTIKDFNKVL